MKSLYEPRKKIYFDMIEVELTNDAGNSFDVVAYNKDVEVCRWPGLPGLSKGDALRIDDIEGSAMAVIRDDS